MTNDERERAFLIGLAKLTRETGVAICATEYCGTPYLRVLSESDVIDPAAGYGYGYAGEIAWIDPKDKYGRETYSDSIVRALPEIGHE